ncbi:hypothetical protein F2Q68_00006547 [Brassica cretica]|uniref:Exostosin GT47 domain-containing protein n=1 Tax=Brassica cretica TaxID=69181 RepID=A0A8S9JD61_BRACR|nr:hypothetical protein F2Q68_00006547 [Brassica cretica]
MHQTQVAFTHAQQYPQMPQTSQPVNNGPYPQMPQTGQLVNNGNPYPQMPQTAGGMYMQQPMPNQAHQALGQGYPSQQQQQQMMMAQYYAQQQQQQAYGNQMGGYGYGYNQQQQQGSSPYLDQQMYGLSMRDQTSHHVPSSSSSTTSYLPPMKHKNKPEDKLFGDLVDISKFKPTTKPTSGRAGNGVNYVECFGLVPFFKPPGLSYELMESKLKVYVYREGKRPVFHKPVLKGIYASEGWFMRQLKASKTFVTKNPRKAHLFYLPFSSKMLEESLYVPGSHSDKNLVKFLKNYLDVVSSKYHFWNKTGGSDHFLVACHDWAPSETRQYMANCIRALCNSDVSEGFVFGKDVALPETTILVPRRPLRALGGKPASQRHILAFFAGGMHGYLRPLLLQTWGGNRDPDMKIFSEIPKSKGKNKSYMEFMKSSKYCICPKGHEVNSPRVVEALFYECIPVIISDNFVPPFFEVINWESFAVFVLEKDIPDLKNILLSISEERYREMQMRVKMVQKHFLWHSKPERFDIFHMILHSIWYNRVFQT